MATGSMHFVDSGLADLDKILRSLEIENKQQQNEIQKEQQQAAVFEAAIIEKEKDIKTLQEDTARLDEETKAAHQQFRRNRETYESLKRHYHALVMNQETAQKDLHELHDRWQVQKPEHERALQHYESIWEQYKAKYEERELAVELRKWQQQTAQTRELLEESQNKVKGLDAAIQDKQEKKKNALKPFKSRNNWIIQIAKVWAETRDIQTEKEKMQQSIKEIERRIQAKKDGQLKLQKEQVEKERKRQLQEAEETKRQEDVERQKQQQLYQQQQLQQLKEQQQQQQQNQQRSRQQQQLIQQQQQPRHKLSPPRPIPQSPLLPPAVRTVQSQYFQSPLIGHAAPRSFAAASPQQPRHPPYLQMPIMASPRQTAASGSSCSTPSYVPQQFTLRMPGETTHKNQLKQPQPINGQSTVQSIDTPSHQDTQTPLPLQGPTHKGVELYREQTRQGSSLVTGQVTRHEPPVKGTSNTEIRLKVNHQVKDGVVEECGKMSGTMPCSGNSEISQQAPAEDPTCIQDPGNPGIVGYLPPTSPFDLEAHIQSLSEMAKSPGFTFSCRPMFGGEEITDEAPDKTQTNAPSSSLSDNLESQFFQPFISEIGGVSKPTSMQMFGSGSNKESSCPTALFGRPDSPMDVGPSRTQEGMLSLFGGGQNKANNTRDDDNGAPAMGFSFNFSSGPDSPNIKSPSEASFTLF